MFHFPLQPAYYIGGTPGRRQGHRRGGCGWFCLAAVTHARGAASPWTPRSDWNPHDAGSLGRVGSSQEGKTGACFFRVSLVALGLQANWPDLRIDKPEKQPPSQQGQLWPDFHVACEVQVVTVLDKYSV